MNTKMMLHELKMMKQFGGNPSASEKKVVEGHIQTAKDVAKYTRNDKDQYLANDLIREYQQAISHEQAQDYRYDPLSKKKGPGITEQQNLKANGIIHW